MKRTSTLEWTVDLNEDKDFPGYMALHLNPRTIQLCLKDGTHQDDRVTVMEISMQELCQLQLMINQCVDILVKIDCNDYYAK